MAVSCPKVVSIISGVYVGLMCDAACFFVCFVALRPKSTAMVMTGWSVYLTTLFPGQA